MAQVNPVQAQKFLGGMDYPTGKDEIVEHTEQQGADQNLMDVLRKSPDRRTTVPTRSHTRSARRSSRAPE